MHSNEKEGKRRRAGYSVHLPHCRSHSSHFAIFSSPCSASSLLALAHKPSMVHRRFQLQRLENDCIDAMIIFEAARGRGVTLLAAFLAFLTFPRYLHSFLSVLFFSSLHKHACHFSKHHSCNSQRSAQSGAGKAELQSRSQSGRRAESHDEGRAVSPSLCLFLLSCLTFLLFCACSL